MLKVEKLCYHYKNGPKVLKDVDFSVKDGQFMAILGNNGVGKSTMLKCFNLETKPNDVINLTDDIKQFVAESGIQSGECIVFNPHTTAGLTITSFWDPAGFEDLQDEICRLIPTRIDFKHQHDTPTDAAGHVKCSLLGVSIPLIIDGGKLVLGGSQGIFFLEFDGPRKRKVYVKVVSD